MNKSFLIFAVAMLMQIYSIAQNHSAGYSVKKDNPAFDKTVLNKLHSRMVDRFRQLDAPTTVEVIYNDESILLELNSAKQRETDGEDIDIRSVEKANNWRKSHPSPEKVNFKWEISSSDFEINDKTIYKTTD